MFESNRRTVVGQTLMDLAKILFAAAVASGFFAMLPLTFRLVAVGWIVVLFLLGWWTSPSKKEV